MGVPNPGTRRHRVDLKGGEVVSVIAFLASSEASFVTGVLTPVDGGVTANTGLNRPPHSEG